MEGGRGIPVSGPRHQPHLDLDLDLDLGERSAFGERVQWNSEWALPGELSPGAESKVSLRLPACRNCGHI